MIQRLIFTFFYYSYDTLKMFSKSTCIVHISTCIHSYYVYIQLCSHHQCSMPINVYLQYCQLQYLMLVPLPRCHSLSVSRPVFLNWTVKMPCTWKEKVVQASYYQASRFFHGISVKSIIERFLLNT